MPDQKRGSSRPELQQAAKSREHFDSYYLALCERILTGYKASSRTRDVLHIRKIVATLHYLRGKHQAAYDTLTVLTEAYASAKFASLEAHALAMQLECHAKLDKPKDRAWIAAALAALKASIEASNASRSIENEAAKWTDPAYLCEQLRAASSALGKEVPSVPSRSSPSPCLTLQLCLQGARTAPYSTSESRRFCHARRPSKTSASAS